MNRREFFIKVWNTLISIWKKWIRPILLIGIIFLFVKFIFKAIVENGSERVVVIVAFVIGLVILTAHLMKIFFNSFTKKLNSILPESIKFWLRILSKILNYISPVIFGIIIYHFWNENSIKTVIILSLLLVYKIGEIIKEEKLATT
ncbi:hypothetical protein [Mesoflavibacter sp. CH_XMU1422-2]|uniref:hypothetical protein n=1 Tax=Mesoflavibacter sp. CH_XMU1422-2 TaxID=3107770 RepID=UPI0030088606